MTELLFCGDPHGNFNNIIMSVFKYKPKAIFLLGDYSLNEYLNQSLSSIIGETQIHWIHGNHDVESSSDYKYLFKSALYKYNLNLSVVDINGIKVAGLGGIFLGEVWNPKENNQLIYKNRRDWEHKNKRKLYLYQKNSIWKHEVDKMKREIKADILITHEAPSSHKYGFKMIDEIAQSLGAKKIFHGHLHTYYSINKNKIRMTGVNLGGVCDLNGMKLC